MLKDFWVFPGPTEGPCGWDRAGKRQCGGCVGEMVGPGHAGLSLGFLNCNEKPLKGYKQRSDMCLNDPSIIALCWMDWDHCNSLLILEPGRQEGSICNWPCHWSSSRHFTSREAINATRVNSKAREHCAANQTLCSVYMSNYLISLSISFSEEICWPWKVILRIKWQN